jgi:EAL domain-containing protein (putative c-di-GMP-specific phosphodiesterase class I)
LRPVHLEALLRYRDGDGRLLPPMAFLPAAERLGLTVAIDRWVVTEALRNPPLAWLNGHDSSFLAINLSAASIVDTGFCDVVLRQLRTGTVPGHRLCFEISDTAAVSNLHALIDFIFRLRLEGCRFCLDNFGSGLSSLAYLKSLPVDFLKIDGVLVKNIARNPVELATVEAIRHIAVAMGIKTIAKGVEEAAVLEKLVLAGIDYVQGFAIHMPQPDLDADVTGAA